MPLVRASPSLAANGVGDNPLFLREIADVSLGPAFRRGALADEHGERVGGVVTMRYGENPKEVIARVERAIESLQESLAGNRSRWPYLDVVVHTFLAMSLFVKEKPVGLFYADCLSPAEPIDEKRYQQFKRLCQATSRALASRAG